MPSHLGVLSATPGRNLKGSCKWRRWARLLRLSGSHVQDSRRLGGRSASRRPARSNGGGGKRPPVAQLVSARTSADKARVRAVVAFAERHRSEICPFEVRNKWQS